VEFTRRSIVVVVLVVVVAPLIRRIISLPLFLSLSLSLFLASWPVPSDVRLLCDQNAAPLVRRPLNYKGLIDPIDPTKCSSCHRKKGAVRSLARARDPPKYSIWLARGRNSWIRALGEVLPPFSIRCRRRVSRVPRLVDFYDLAIRSLRTLRGYCGSAHAARDGIRFNRADPPLLFR